MTVSTPVVLTEKLRRPEAGGLSRHRLEARLLDDTRSRLHLVVAPPGSGKTTLLAGVAAACEVPVAWYRVTADDAAESALVAHLGRALGDVLGTGHDVTAIADLLQALEGWPGPGATVILDDLHEIAGSPAELALEQFIALRPQGLRVLVGSRRQPEINIPRLRVSGLLQEISSDDLRFRSWEVEELFQAVFREPLSPESAAALTRRTGGWAAGLQLFHLATAGRSAVDRQRADDDLGGRCKLVRSYLARNVLAELPEDRRHFLLRTCTLGAPTGELCDALLETTGSRKILDELEQRQLFTSSEDDGETFRYHQVLRTHLEWALVQEYGTAGARRWYSRSAALLESVGDRRGAVQAYARAEDWGSVARLLQIRGTGAGDPAVGADLLLPPSVVEHDPWLSLAEARRRLREGSLLAAAEGFRRAESLLDEPDFRDICRQERGLAQLWSDARWTGSDRAAPAGHWSVQLRAATRYPHHTGRPATTDAAGRLGRQPTPDSADRLGRGLAALVQGEFSVAAALLASVQDDPDTDTAHRLIAELAFTVLDAVTAAGGDPAGRMGRIALDAELAGLPWVARLARGLEEAVLVALGSASWRMRSCLDLLAECDRAGDGWGAAVLRLATAIAGQVADADADPAEFADAARRFRELGAPVPELWADALQALALARSGSVRAAALAADIARRAGALRLGGAAVLVGTASAATRIRGPGGGSGDIEALPDQSVRGSEPTAFARDGGPHADAMTLRRLAEALLRPPPATDRDPAPSTAGPVSAVPGTDPDGPARAATGPLPGGAPTTEARPTAAPPTESPPTESPMTEASTTSRAAVASPAVSGALTAEPEPSTPAMQIRCLGGFEITVEGHPLNLGGLRPRARALLRLLCLTPHRDVHREYLVDALWPGTDLTIGTRRLQVALSSVRQVLEHAGLSGAEVLARQGDAYRLAPPAGSVIDVVSFQKHLAAAEAAAGRGDTTAAMTARRAALGQYRGDALPEDGPAEYVVGERERLRLAAAAAAVALAQDSRTLGHPRQALAAARMSVQLDRYQDLGWQLLVALHEESGDNSAAASARHEHAQVQAELELVTG